MTLDDAMRQACAEAGVKPPPVPPAPGRWKRTDTLGKNGRNDASILIFDDMRGGIIFNWQTQVKHPFRIAGPSGPVPVPVQSGRERREREQEEQAIAAKASQTIVRSAVQGGHAYLEAKGFPEEVGLVHDLPHKHMPAGRLGEAMLRAMPKGEGPWLIVPGRVGKEIVTVQFIGPDGAKKNILRGRMSGASHRIATGRETWVCEGIATALTVRAALRLLGRSATILSAFSASNAAGIAESIPGAVLAADHDKPVEAFDGLGTGEFYARRSGRDWVMPPEMGDWNDFQQRHGLRAVAVKLREVGC